VNRQFQLYPEERHWWSFNDYGAVVDAVADLKAARDDGRVRAQAEFGAEPFALEFDPAFRALEFGPGSSTLSLIEGGATHIDTCEDDDHWATVHQDRLVSRFPDIVHIHRYVWSQRICVPTIDGRTYDVGLIDGPRASTKRVPVLNYALERCTAVILAMDATPGLTRRFDQITKGGAHTVEIRETGPHAGRFAIIARVPQAVSPARSASE
jgi:hypothetical protein